MKTRKFFAFLLALVLCFSLTTTSFAAEKTETANKVESVETNETVQPRAGGGSAARYITEGTDFSFTVGGSGMKTIRIEVSGTTSGNTVWGTVFIPNGNELGFEINGNSTFTKTYFFSLPAGTYSVHAQPLYDPAVIAVYVE